MFRAQKTDLRAHFPLGAFRSLSFLYTCPFLGCPMCTPEGVVVGWWAGLNQISRYLGSSLLNICPFWASRVHAWRGGVVILLLLLSVISCSIATIRLLLISVTSCSIATIRLLLISVISCSIAVILLLLIPLILLKLLEMSCQFCDISIRCSFVVVK